MKDIDPYSLAERAATVLADETGIVDHDVALVLGSGWASAIDEIGDISAEVEMDTLPGFPEPTVLGHRNLIRSLKVNEKNVLVLGGRAHLYEGHSVDTVVHGVRVAIASGCKMIILTNAAGGLNPEWPVGQPVLISDQLNLMGQSPMVGPAPPDGKAIRFVDLTEAYSARLRQLAQEVDPTLPQGVYAGLLGGALYTSIEIGLSFSAYVDRTIAVLTVGDVMQGLFKSFVFALIITLVGASNGFSVTGGAEGVGKATTRSVVLSISFIVIADMIFTYFLNR